MTYAPIVLFVYNRAEHTKQTVEALLKNPEAKKSELYIFADGPKKGKDPKVEEVRNYIDTITGFKEIHIKKHNKNIGLANSVIAGVTEIVNKYGRIIVMEDDLVTTAYFLKFMNEALDRYENSKKVFTITGYSYLLKGSKKLKETYFLNNVSSWTWATWKDRWKFFDGECNGWEELLEDKELAYRFDHDGVFSLTAMMNAQMNLHTIDSWAVRWNYNVFKQNGISLFPNYSLVTNSGRDGTGTHKDNTKTNQILQKGPITYFPDEPIELPETRKVIDHQKHKERRAHYFSRAGFYLTHPLRMIKKVNSIGKE